MFVNFETCKSQWVWNCSIRHSIGRASRNGGTVVWVILIKCLGTRAENSAMSDSMYGISLGVVKIELILHEYHQHLNGASHKMFFYRINR